jgi:tRNA modification GTPase
MVVWIRAALERNEVHEASELLAELTRHAAVGRHLTSPWRVVVGGAPNVGKSSLVNALAGFQRSVVSATPGTTRDVVTTLLAIDGWPVELADTAGWRTATEDLEQQGIDRARTAVSQADLCLWVLDASAEPVWPPDALPGVRLVVNKIDLPPAWNLKDVGSAVRVSAQTGEGLADLCQALAQWLVPEPPPPGAAVPFTPPLCEWAGEVRRCCALGQAQEALRLLDAWPARTNALDSERPA